VRIRKPAEQRRRVGAGHDRFKSRRGVNRNQRPVWLNAARKSNRLGRAEIFRQRIFSRINRWAGIGRLKTPS
jgi:hypothetical protein